MNYYGNENFNPYEIHYDEYEHYNYTALHIASGKGYLDIVLMLLDAGADVNNLTFCDKQL